MAAPGPLDAIRDQVRGVRRRRNALAVQRAAYELAGVAAGLAALVVLAALRAGRLGFALAVVAALGGLAVALAGAARTVRHGWLSRAAAPGWIDGRGVLQGRLATLLSLRRVPEHPFERLLAAQTAARLRSLRPERLVPRVVPWGALAAAGAGAAALLAVLLAAPALRPSRPILLVGDRAIGSVAGEPGTGAPSQLLVAPGAEQRSGDAAGAGGEPGDDVPPAEALADLSDRLQDWVQEALWGEAGWEPGEAPEGEEEPGEEAGGGERRRGRPERRAGVGAGSGDTPGRDGVPADERAASARAQMGTIPPDGGTPGGGDGGSGAGTGSDPRLYGAARADEPGGGSRFELAIAARVRTRPGGALDPAGGAPPAEPDRNPALAAAQWPEKPAHRMAVPPAWQGVVRRLFAHDRPAAP